ncbi:sterol desaturase family protein [Streptomyces clavuligerus]|nr:sterol desaturase family protein [Streptomyces clavuligerus]QPL66347.1 sterol desaturase family protein [Streptomyces clavuligerus]QPL72383.1 sterol desaturase family protein [Streptomyces clavuligerus]QPL78456.1 sterol desaturase family protein [Streptomyces clavuligerus]QPL84483.1 sterol desaturase family protein [Streptomyces clavuligerus]
MLRTAAYPFLLAATVATAVAALTLGWDPALVSPLFLMGVLLYLTGLERLIPFEPSWHPSRKEWGWYGTYFLLTMGGSAFAQALVTLGVGALAPSQPTAALWIEALAALLTGSLAGYLLHRISHTNALLWRVHGVHHVPRKVNVANNGVNHVLDIVVVQGCVQLALALCGFSREAVFAAGLFVTAQGYFVHANIDVRIGRLNHLLASPEQHRLHHSTVLPEAGHFGSDLSVWDHLFGSYTWRPGRAPAAVGLGDPASFPGTGEFLASLLHPLRPRRRETGPG